MTERFTASQKQRFRKLLVLAAESPYRGERQAALAAAERLAGRFDMTLEQAAQACRGGQVHDGGSAARAQTAGDRARQAWKANVYAHYAYDAAASRARQRHREDVAAAQRQEETRRREEQAWRRNWSRRSSRRMPPGDFARLLITQTRLPLTEISAITGISQHDLVGLKLKLRPVLR